MSKFAKYLKHHDDDLDQYDPKEVEMGLEVEREHSDDLSIRKAITAAHLAEIPDYYTRLKKMENGAGVKD